MSLKDRVPRVNIDTTMAADAAAASGARRGQRIRCGARTASQAHRTRVNQPAGQGAEQGRLPTTVRPSQEERVDRSWDLLDAADVLLDLPDRSPAQVLPGHGRFEEWVRQAVVELG